LSIDFMQMISIKMNNYEGDFLWMKRQFIFPKYLITYAGWVQVIREYSMAAKRETGITGPQLWAIN